MRTSSIHICPVVAGKSESHNLRDKEIYYMRDLGLKNEDWIDSTISERKAENKALYRQEIGNKPYRL